MTNYDGYVSPGGYSPRGPNVVEQLNEHAQDHEFINELGITVGEYEDGVLRLTAPYNERFRNPGMDGSVHGGIVMSVLDTVMAFTVMAAASQDDRRHTGPTISMTTNFLASSSEPLVGIGELVRMGRSTAVIDGTLVGRDSGETIATAQGVWRIYYQAE